MWDFCRSCTVCGVIVAGGVGSPSVQAIESSPFITGFESSDSPSYALGDLDGQGASASWTVLEGSAAVQSALVSRGARAVELQAASSVEVSVGAGHNIVWTDLQMRTDGSLDPPEIPSEPASSVLYFGETSGLMALDGDGTGGGAYVLVLNPFPNGQFVRVSIRQDYTAKTYDVWIGGIASVSGLGFKDNSVSSISTVQFDAEGVSYLDDVSVTEEGIDADTDSDYLKDLDEMKYYGSSPTIADTDGDTMIDGDEVFVGTSATDPGSVFTADLTRPGGGQLTVSFQTIPARLYAVQQTVDPLSAPWAAAPGLGSIVGDGTLKQVTVDETPDRHDFRVAVRQQ